MSNQYFTRTSALRDFELVQNAFDKMPPLSGNGGLPVFVKSDASGLEALSASSARSALGVYSSSQVDALLGTRVAWTPTIDGGGTLAATSAHYYRIGGQMKARFTVTLGTVAATTCAVPLPSGFEIDTTNVAANQIFGVLVPVTTAGASLDVGAATFVLFYDGSDESKLFITNTSISGNMEKRNTSAVFANNWKLSSFFEVPTVTV